MTLPGDEPRVSLPDVAPVVRPGRSPRLAVALIVVAFALGAVRPWDWLGSPASGAWAGPTTVPRPTADLSGLGGGAAGDGGSGANGGAGAVGRPSLGPGSAGSQEPPSPTCGSPLGWRAATIESWTGRQARVWTAADAVMASGPADRAIPIRAIVAETVTAIGWCAPVGDEERPPHAATATLFQVRDGVATEIAYDQLEPAAPDALGELLVPPAASTGRRSPWAPGRYVIRLAAPGGTYLRYLGLEVMRTLPSSSSPPATGQLLP